jgi:hypothetical protein
MKSWCWKFPPPELITCQWLSHHALRHELPREHARDPAAQLSDDTEFELRGKTPALCAAKLLREDGKAV